MRFFRWSGVVVSLSLLLAASMSSFAQSKPRIKNIVLVHGAFADGSSWAKVIPILESKGYHVTVVQNPLTSLTDDVNAALRIIALQDGPTILVGHSWGGVVITQAGNDPKVKGLVYVAAYMPDQGKSANDTSGPYGPTPGQKSIQLDDKHYARVSSEGAIKYFAQGLPMTERRTVLAVQGQTYGPMFDEKITRAAWKSKPSWHVIATEDLMLFPTMEETQAIKAGGKAFKIPACHVAMLQQPQKVAEVIMAAANGAKP
ncbi:alpha/beta hydrolase [Terriglobus sp. TAA 43]|uniref:alpha/beta hydrolase n=1 Tax=Terriglobus sp. TAA 43 TaxID=278961 RepID=UPI00068F6AF3|nr:alpha/beta hydrolase [Terriglobus sp. TAA 43]